MVGFFLPLYFPPKEGLCLCIFLPCHVYIPSIHSPQGANPWGYCTPTKIYTRQPKEVQSSLDQERTFRLKMCQLESHFVGHGTFSKSGSANLATGKTHLLDGQAHWAVAFEEVAWLDPRRCNKPLLFVQRTSSLPLPTLCHCVARSSNFANFKVASFGQLLPTLSPLSRCG